MPVPPAAVELLTAAAPVLGRWGRWYVFGAQAVMLYGVPRLSADVDVTLALVPDAPERFAREMAEGGFTLRVNDAEFVRRTRVIPFVHQRTGMPLDVVLAGSGLEDEFLTRAVLTDLPGTAARSSISPTSSGSRALLSTGSLATRADYLDSDDPAREALLQRAHAATESASNP